MKSRTVSSLSASGRRWCGARIVPIKKIVLLQSGWDGMERDTAPAEKGKTMVEWAKVIALTIFVCVFIIHEVRDAVERDMEEVRELNRMLLRLNSNAETDPIVRCKDCKHKGGFGCPWWKGEDIPDDWYCANGEREENATN